MPELWEMKQSIEDAIRCLDDAAEDAATIAVECDDQWKELNALADRIAAVLTEARKLLPLDHAMETEIQHHDDEADRYADWLASGNYPGR